MPTALRIGPYRLFFYAGDRDEPQHIHVERNDKTVKFWLDPVRMQSSGGFSRAELGRIQKIIQENHTNLVRFAHNWNNGIMECWNIGFRFYLVEKYHDS